MAQAARGIGRAAGINDWTRVLNGQALPGPKYLTPENVAQMLQVSVKRIYGWPAADPTMPADGLGEGPR